ncbi:cytoplasmic glycerophosphodiester phosphodiesterase [Allorhodopirellula heiligendammensis]|uniref:Cytoplasmic glycerophosphodiester phosphodiesterase n=2 Tax=Allorhodopirellula heiligendammensis TaxID=2714739 RepID=A0A5C6BXJ0_9BACT|nr:cytoplasmic glycerophosphodiester phosphodiesterase [Allorhodopirellula heiligendammensis]
MYNMITWLFGASFRERIAIAMSYTLAIVTIALGLQLKLASKSPNPAKWNTYSQQANSHLYDGLNPAKPIAMPVISHRGGDVPGIDEAGTLARLDYNYARGQRLFELDFSWTADDQIVVKHDWKERSEIPTLEEFLSESPTDHTSLSMVYDWLVAHPDAFVVTDCKKRSLAAAARIRMERPELVAQFILQIYQYKDFELVQSQGYQNVILTLYRCLVSESANRIADFAAEHDLFAITVPRSRSSDPELPRRLNQLGVPIYVHTVNDNETALDLQRRGFYGVYSDSLTTETVGRIAQRKPAEYPDKTVFQ